jgi:hypothetical protein
MVPSTLAEVFVAKNRSSVAARGAIGRASVWVLTGLVSFGRRRGSGDDLDLLQADGGEHVAHGLEVAARQAA